jgi:uncharacterized damage-inducible protein DinB
MQNRRDIFLSAMAALPAAALAQQQSDWSNPFAKALLASFRLHWVDTKEYTLSMLEAMPADSFDFKAHPTQRGFGDQLAHLAWANVAYFRAFGPSLGVEDRFPKTYADVRKEYPVENKEAVRKFVAATFDFSLAALDKMTQKDLMRTDIVPFPKSPTHSALDMLFRAYMHTAHHRGQVVTYLRVKGLVPPAWKFEPHA